MGMAHIIAFGSRESFDWALEIIRETGGYVDTLEAPEFCRGLAIPAIVVSGDARPVLSELRAAGVKCSGVFPFLPFTKDVPQAAPPNEKWVDIFGHLRIDVIEPSFTAPSKFRVEIAFQKSLATLIPFLARLIRGGSFRPDVPILSFEEEHRLLVISPRRLVICRADDLLDIWIMMRCAVELVTAGWDRRFALEPEREPRQGIGAIEIFKRLPGTDCRQCGLSGCMEFAMSLLVGRRRVGQCVPLEQHSARRSRASLLWLLETIGAMGSTGSVPTVCYPRPPEIPHPSEVRA